MNRNKRCRKKMMAGLAAGMAGIVGIMPVSAAEGTPISKQETVYVNANANGEETKITVSEWLKNAGLEKVLTDESELTGIQNVKGEETFEQTNGTVTWKTEGKDIYYQGTSKKELPVSVKFTYYLNGREMTPQELKGKSGKLRIHIAYDNHTKKEAVIKGKTEELSSPFVMVTGMIFPEEHFSNVVIDNGRVISDGDRNLVVGVAMPGLQESLGLQEKKEASLTGKLQLPDSLEVTADVTDFAMDPTFTVAFSDLLEELQLDQAEDLDGAMDALGELEDAALRLVSGAAELSQGTDTLGSGFGEFEKGVGTLKGGADALYGGASQLSQGIDSYTQGADTLNAGIQKYMGKDGVLTGQMTEYVNGVNQAVKGVEDYTAGTLALADGIQTYVAGEEQLAAGARELTALQEGLTEVKAAITALHGAVDGQGAATEDIYAASLALTKGTKALKDSLSAMETLMGQVDEMTAAGRELTEAAGSLSSEAQSQLLEPVGQLLQTGTQMLAYLETLSGELQGLEDVCQQAVGDAGTALCAQVNGQIEEKNGQIAAVKGAAESSNAQMDTVIGELNAQIARASEAGDTEMAGALSQAVQELSGAKIDTGSLGMLSPVEMPQTAVEIPTPDLAGLGTMAADMQTAFQQIQSAFGELTPQLQKLDQQLEQMAAQKDRIPTAPMEQLKGAVSQLDLGMQGLHGAIGTLSSQLALLDQQTESLPKAAEGIGQLTAGFGALSQANPLLLEGADTLKMRTPELVEGVETLAGGTRQLGQGLTTLSGELAGGSAELAGNSEALRGGASQLVAGTDELSAGALTLQQAGGAVEEGIFALQKGALQLKDGTVEFHEEGIKKLQETADDLLGTLLDRVDVLTSDTCSYDSYAGKAEHMDGTVKFIIETEGIQ